MSDCRVISKKVFMESAALAYKLLKKTPNMSVHLQLDSSVVRKVRVRYWVYNYTKSVGRYMIPGGDLKTCFENVHKEENLNP